jgi:hypothetical protein
MVKQETASSETSVNPCQTGWGQMSKDGNSHTILSIYIVSLMYEKTYHINGKERGV